MGDSCRRPCHPCVSVPVVVRDWAGDREAGGRSGMGSPSVVATESDREDEVVAGPRLKKARRGGRAPRPSDNRRKASKRKNSEERGASSGVRMRTPREGALSGDVVVRVRVVFMSGVHYSSE